MPEQGSRRGVGITQSNFEAPFDSPIFRYGVGGLNLRAAADALDPGQYRRLTNAFHAGNGELTARAGLTTLTDVGDDIHSVRRLNDPEDGTFTRVWGQGNALAIGQSGALTEVDTGYSTDPLTLVPYRPPLSDESWMFVGDRLRTRKVRPDGLDLPIGMTPPAAAPSVTVQAAQVTPICEFAAVDGTQASAWTNNAGFDYSEVPNPTAIPVTTDGGGIDGDTVEFKAQPSTSNAVFAAAKGYYSYWGLPRTLNLNLVGSVAAEDDDLLHLWVKFSHPDLTAEFRLYFVVSEVFDASILPGTAFTNANADFYMKTWRQNDFALFLQARAAQIDTAEVARVRAVRDQDLKNRAITDTRTSWEQRRASIDPARTISLQTGAGREQWLEYGVVGLPVRRGDFARFGADETRTWGTVTGIIIYLQTVDGTGGETAVSLDDCYLTGGSGPDTTEPGAQQYDYRCTHFDPRTGAEGNPSPTQTATTYVDAARQAISVDPLPYGDTAVRQRIYRRGGSLIADWYFVGENDADGEAFLDTLTDANASSAGTLELDNDAFVTSVDDEGEAVYSQPVPIIFGPLEDLLFALGDPLRPGVVYYCKPGQPDSWPASNYTEVCAPGEQLMNGGIVANQAFCLSEERGFFLYPNLTGTATSVTAVPSSCQKGLAAGARWAMAIGFGAVWFIARDGAYRTGGGPADRFSDDIQPLFDGKTVEGYSPIDFTAPTFLRLAFHEQDLYFLYKDTLGTHQALVYSVLYQYWRAVQWSSAASIQSVYSDEGGHASLLICGGDTSNRAFTATGTSDNGTAIAVTARTGDLTYGRAREDKLFGDLILHANRNAASLTVTTRLNDGQVVNAGAVISTGADRQPYILDVFGLKPQKARTLSVEVAWSSTATPPILYQMAPSIIPQPDVTLTRVTQWEDLGHPDEVYLTGLTLDVDTGDGTKQFYVEYDNADLAGVWATLGPYEVDHDDRHKKKFSWPAVKANLVRIRPYGDCLPWQLYRADWIFDPEPPRIAGWDINHENGWDQYVTGLDLECNTFNLVKTVELYLDQALIHTFSVQANGRRVVHLTVQPPRRGHILHFVATDANPGLLYSHRWHSDPEPSEQTNWNQNYVTPGLHDKKLKGVLIEADTFGQNKSVTIEIDGAVVETITVNTNGRLLREFSWPQHEGRVFRMLPVDNFPGRLYSHQWIFDSEPLALSRWETQEITHGMPGWHQVLYGEIAYRSTTPITILLTAFNQVGDAKPETYTLPATGGEKRRAQFNPRQSAGIQYKWVITSTSAFWLYREETVMMISPWGSANRVPVHVFGSDDLDASRPMGVASLQAQTAGGALGD